MILAGARGALVVPGARAARSWPSINTLLFDLTEPVLRPVRRVIPPAGMFDLSFIVVFFVLIILQSTAASDAGLTGRDGGRLADSARSSLPWPAWM